MIVKSQWSSKYTVIRGQTSQNNKWRFNNLTKEKEKEKTWRTYMWSGENYNWSEPISVLENKHIYIHYNYAIERHVFTLKQSSENVQKRHETKTQPKYF